MTKYEQALNLIHVGNLGEAKRVFEEALLDDPKNPDILYNLGMCFTDLGEPDKAITILKKSTEYNPKHANSYVALGYAYSRIDDNKNAQNYFLHALELDPNNSYALRNLGGIFGKNGDIEKSLFYLKKAYKLNPTDVNTIYGLGYCYQQIKEYGEADQYYRKVIETDALPKLKELAKDGLREIAFIHLKSKGLRMDAVMYMVSALTLFAKESMDRTKDIAFKIALKGRSGFESHQLHQFKIVSNGSLNHKIDTHGFSKDGTSLS
jgi:tetratricopeptide (TPR) repeat protein